MKASARPKRLAHNCLIPRGHQVRYLVLALRYVDGVGSRLMRCVEKCANFVRDHLWNVDVIWKDFGPLSTMTHLFGELRNPTSDCPK